MGNLKSQGTVFKDERTYQKVVSLKKRIVSLVNHILHNCYGLLTFFVHHYGFGVHQHVHPAGEHIVQQVILLVKILGRVQGGQVGRLVRFWFGGHVYGLAGPGGQRHAVHDGQSGFGQGAVQGDHRFGLEAHGDRFG